MLTVIWDPDLFYQWPSFLIPAIIYTAVVCSGELSKEGPLIFSRRNSRSLSAIFGIHAVFLTILFVLWKFAAIINPHLPNSMTNYYVGRGGSIFNTLFIIGMIVLQFIERRWLIVERDPDPSPKSRGLSS